MDVEYHKATRRSGYRYLFTDKHHGGGTSSDARWEPSITNDEEFEVFDAADRREVRDNSNNMYGVLRNKDTGSLRFLGTWNQQVAMFPAAPHGQPWHGYPLIAIEAPRGVHPRRRKVPREAWDRLLMEHITEHEHEPPLLTSSEVHRLKKGRHA